VSGARTLRAGTQSVQALSGRARSNTVREGRNSRRRYSGYTAISVPAVTHTAFRLGLHKIFVHFNAIVNEPHHCTAPPTCKAHTVAIVLHDYCAMNAPPPTLLLYGIHHTILVMAILCKGQIPARLDPCICKATVSSECMYVLCKYLAAPAHARVNPRLGLYKIFVC